MFSRKDLEVPWLTGQAAVLALLLFSAGMAIGYAIGRRDPDAADAPPPSAELPPARPVMDPRPPVEARDEDDTIVDLRAQLHASRSALQSAVRRMEEQRRAIRVLEADLDEHTAALEAAHRDLDRARMGWEVPGQPSDPDGG